MRVAWWLCKLTLFPYVAGFETLGNFEVTSSTGSFSFPVVGLLTNTQLRVVTTSAPYVASPVVDGACRGTGQLARASCAPPPSW